MQDNYVVIDIETVPNLEQRLVDYVVEKVSPPNTMSKQETIDKWWQEKGEDAKKDAIHAMGLKGGLGRVLCVGLTVGDGDAVCFMAESMDDDGERAVLQSLNNVMSDLYDKTRRQPYFIGHYISGFDLRYIWQRMVILGLKPALHMPHDDTSWKGTYFDTMTAWAGVKERVSLDDLCLYLGVESPKGECTGSKVWEFAQAGRFDEISEYCKADVLATRECYKRMTFQ